MKQSAAKTLGVVFVGAAFAAAAAGSASAAVTPATPDVAGTLGSVAGPLPLVNSPSNLPAGADQSLDAGRTALGSTVSKALPGQHVADPLSGLLGGLPTSGLPTSGLSGNALPSGAVPGLGG